MKRLSLPLTLIFLLLFSCKVEDPTPIYTLSTISVPSEGGSINVSPPSDSYTEGDQVTLIPQASEGYVFQNWEGDAIGNPNPLSIVMSSNKLIVGVFIKKEYPLSITIEGEGTVFEEIITNPSERQYPHGTQIKLTPLPKEGWEFDQWIGDLTGHDFPKNLIVNEEKKVTAKFRENIKIPSSSFANTVWVGDDDYEPCDCGFAGIIGFSENFLFELGEFGSKEPSGCFPMNFDYRDYEAEIKNFVVLEDKITFNLISNSLDWFHELEIVEDKLVIKSSTTFTSGITFLWTQTYVKSEINFSDFCK